VFGLWDGLANLLWYQGEVFLNQMASRRSSRRPTAHHPTLEIEAIEVLGDHRVGTVRDAVTTFKEPPAVLPTPNPPRPKRSPAPIAPCMRSHDAGEFPCQSLEPVVAGPNRSVRT
jgi:hypothetical protein